MARLPPSCHAVHRGLRIPDLRAGDDSPLRTSHHHALPATCRSRRLPTQRLRPCGLNATSRTQSGRYLDIVVQDDGVEVPARLSPTEADATIGFKRSEIG